MSQSQQVVPEYLEQQLAGLLLTLADRTLLVPNTAIAELVAWQPTVSGDSAQLVEGQLGHIEWRGLRLPLVSFEVLGGEQEPDVTEDSRIAIFNRLTATDGARFYAILLQGIPRSTLVDRRLQQVQHAALRKGELQAVEMDGQRMHIPDLEAVEHSLFS